MSSYSVTINLTQQAREAISNSGYNLVIAKGLTTHTGTVNSTDYNTAWYVWPSDTLTSMETIGWTVNFSASFMQDLPIDGGSIVAASSIQPVSTGKVYMVDKSGDIVEDPKGKSVGPTSIGFNDVGGYNDPIAPVLYMENSKSSGQLTPFWYSTLAVMQGFGSSIRPVEIVRVWLGQYQASTAVLAVYASPVLQFDLTSAQSGEATIDYDGRAMKFEAQTKNVSVIPVDTLQKTYDPYVVLQRLRSRHPRSENLCSPLQFEQ